MRAYIDLGVVGGFRFKVGRSRRVTRALAAGHITGREAGLLHRLDALAWRIENLGR